MNKPLGVVLIAVLCTNLFSVILRVPSDFPNIQSAVTASLDGDTVLLSDGVYTGPSNRGIVIENKNITIKSGSNSPTQCTIDCELEDRAFYFGAGVTASSITGIKMINGRSVNTPVNRGGLIFVVNQSNVTIDNCIFENGSVGDIPAVAFGSYETWIYDTTPSLIINSIFRSNGRCIQTDQQSLTTSGCLFEYNTEVIWCNGWDSNPDGVMENCVLRFNTSPSFIVLLSHENIISNCLLYENIAPEIVRMSTTWDGRETMNHCTLAYNHSDSPPYTYWDSHGDVSNSIVWGDDLANNYVNGNVNDIGAYYSCLSGGWIGPGANNIFIDPQFVDPLNHNYFLQPTSPCVGTGDEGSNMGCNPDLLPMYADVFDIVATPTIGEVPLSVAFNIFPNPPLDALTFWDFDNDGVTDSGEPSPTYTYTEPGFYSVKLIVQNGAETDTTLVEDMITVTMPANPRIVASPDTLRYGNVATNSTVTKPVNIYNWGGEDLEIFSISAANARYSITLPTGLSYPIVIPSLESIEIAVNFSPLAVQAYNTNLVIVSNDPNNGVLTKWLEGNGYLLNADFSATPLSGDIPLLVQFNDMSQGDILSRLWDFGDGNTSTELNPAHTYVQKGLYDVTLTVQDQYTTRSLAQQGYITAIAHPIIATPDSSGIDFGIVYLGDTGTHQLMLQSAGTDSVFVASVGFYQPGSAYLVVPESIPDYILPGMQAILDVSFHPYQASTYNDTLYVYNSSENKPILKIKLRGIGEYVPPQTPQGVTIVIDGYDAVISWEAVTQNIYNTPITVPYYFIYGSLIPNPGPTEQIFIGYSTGTTFHHAGVNLPGSNVQPPPQYFYTVTAVVWYPPRNINIALDDLIGRTKEEVERQLR